MAAAASTVVMEVAVVEAMGVAEEVTEEVATGEAG